MQEAQISFKGTVNGLTIILREEDEFEAIINNLEEKVKSAGKFFKGATLSVLYKGKELTKTEEDRIYDLLSQKSGANILSLNKEAVESNPDINIQSVQYQPPKLKMNDHFFKGIEQGPTKFHRGTVRSGQLVSYAGNVVIVGDVNPGGEVVANGNVVVLGALKGMVHAGADGNREAIVIALNLAPMQLRIADVITRSPDEDDGSTAIHPEVASVKDDRVIIVGL